MNASREPQTCTRRTVLQQGLALSLLSSGAGALGSVSEAGRSSRRLVLLHLSGGNDGLNTIIPYADPLYRELRPRLGVVARSAIRIDGQMGFHPALGGMARLFDEGKLGIVQGVGYAGPDYSHVGSCRIWADGGRRPQGRGAWWDAVLDQTRGTDSAAVCVGGGPAAMLVSPQRLRTAGGERLHGAAGKPVDYERGSIERTLATAAQIAVLPGGPSLILATVGGFDTHTDQLDRHERVFGELSDALVSFTRELERRGRWSDVLLIAWSEFGRRPAENATGGTDHGSAGVAFLLGGTLRGGLYGQRPSLEVTDFGNLVPTAGFATLYESGAAWLGCAGPVSIS